MNRLRDSYADTGERHKCTVRICVQNEHCHIFSHRDSSMRRYAAIAIHDVGYVHQDRAEMEVWFGRLAHR